MTSPGVTEAESVRAIATCLDVGINFLDTAYAYGRAGESDRRIADAIAGRREEIVIATKIGLSFGPNGERILDGSPSTLYRQCDESLRRLRTDRVELLFLHEPDPKVPIEESALALRGLMDAGKARAIAISNCKGDELERFAEVCPTAAVQLPFNMLRRVVDPDVLARSRRYGASILAYWPLMKGLLAGRLPRDHVFDPSDGRRKYASYQGAEWNRNVDLVEALGEVARLEGLSVVELVLRWTIHQPSIVAAIVGAKRPDQVVENARGLGPPLARDTLRAVEAALAAHEASLVGSTGDVSSKAPRAG
jgi:aryl-alcohol dehydrogenase-like predicted oxidoreductase